jgi:hypothetical protein
MKTLNRLLLFVGLSLVPALVFAAQGSAVVSGLAVGDENTWGPASTEICSDATPAGMGSDAVTAPDCATEDGSAGNIAAPVSMDRKPGCKACTQQPWCACTYQGHPRVSCDPCCYQTYAGQICTS